jgi:hypothetical protein
VHCGRRKQERSNVEPKGNGRIHHWIVGRSQKIHGVRAQDREDGDNATCQEYPNADPITELEPHTCMGD